MYRRRQNPYDPIDHLENSRRSIVDLILIATLLGFLINLLTSVVYDALKDEVFESDPAQLRILMGILSVLILILLMGFVLRYHSRSESQSHRMEIVFPYVAVDKLEISEQHPYRPRYEPVVYARNDLRRLFRSKPKLSQQLADEWNQWTDRRFQFFINDLHNELIDAVMLHALHRYGKETLSAAAEYAWWHTPLNSAECPTDKLKLWFESNRILAAFFEDEKNASWKLLLPQNVDLAIERHPKGHHWQLKHRFYGKISILFLKTHWVSRKGQPNAIFAEGLDSSLLDNLYVVGTRFVIQAEFRMTMLRRSAAFHEWSTYLIAFLEEALDWGYFLEHRPQRMLVDLPWKIGDLPSGASLWEKLNEIEHQLPK